MTGDFFRSLLELRNRIGWWEHDGEASPIIPVRAERPPALETSRIPRAWESQPNADFRNRLAIAEGNGDKPDYGYGEVYERTGALGRYQMTPAALQAIGMMDGAGNWTGKYDIHSRAGFLADPEAQEQALTAYLDGTEKQLKANGSFSFIGTHVTGLVSPFTITRAGLIAAGHREGATATRRYLAAIASHSFNSRSLRMDRQRRAIETRLRTFSDASYE